MLTDSYPVEDVFARVLAVATQIDPVLKTLDTLLEDDQLYQTVRADVGKRYPQTLVHGRHSTPVEVILRLLLLKHLYGWSYEETVKRVADSLVLRWFCRVYFQLVRTKATLIRWNHTLPLETVHALNDRVVQLAVQAKVTQGRKLRLDATCVQTEIHHPTDSGLMVDSVRLRTPDALGNWAWGAWSEKIPLPPTVFKYLGLGATTQAPTLREIRSDDGSRVAVLDLMLEVPAKYVSPLEQETRVLGFDWGVRSLITVSILEKPEGDEPYRQVSRPVFLDTGGIDGRQARLRREIDRLKACRDRYTRFVKQARESCDEHQSPLPAHFPGWQKRVSEYDARITACWKTYERRNRELAHLASNLLI